MFIIGNIMLRSFVFFHVDNWQLDSHCEDVWERLRRVFVCVMNKDL